MAPLRLPPKIEGELDQPDAGGQPLTPLAQLEHLIKVVASVAKDANGAWGEVWDELKPCSAGSARGKMPEGFNPKCGWPEFLEKYWMIKFYVDSIARVCQTGSVDFHHARESWPKEKE